MALPASPPSPITFHKQDVKQGFHKHSANMVAPNSPLSPASDSDGEMLVSPHQISLLSPRISKPADWSAPSSAVSSPPPAVSILRRESVSDPDRGLKFTVAPIPPHPVHQPPFIHPNLIDQSDDSDLSDAGYQEDSEDGEFSDEDDEITSPIPKPAFARPTNYDHSPSPAPSAPAFQPPPSRRGRGHIRVKDDHEAPKACSRHCSPPPKSRSGSERGGRLSDAGPRGARAGSPMPDVSALPSEDDDDSGASDEDPLAQDQDAPALGVSFNDLRRPSISLPAIDNTPAVGAPSKGDDNLYHRLEDSLSLHRSQSVGSRPSPRPSLSSHPLSADE